MSYFIKTLLVSVWKQHGLYFNWKADVFFVVFCFHLKLEGVIHVCIYCLVKAPGDSCARFRSRLDVEKRTQNLIIELDKHLTEKPRRQSPAVVTAFTLSTNCDWFSFSLIIRIIPLVLFSCLTGHCFLLTA